MELKKRVVNYIATRDTRKNTVGSFFATRRELGNCIKNGRERKRVCEGDLWRNDFVVTSEGIRRMYSPIFHSMRTRAVRSVSGDFEQTSLPCLFYFVSVPPLSASFLCYKVPFTRRLLSALRTESIWTPARRGSAYTQVHFGRCTFVARDSHTAVRILPVAITRE